MNKVKVHVNDIILKISTIANITKFELNMCRVINNSNTWIIHIPVSSKFFTSADCQT